MLNTKLLKLLKILSKSELKRFRKLLQSPFYTSNTHLILLFDYLKKYHPAFNAPRISREKAYWLVYKKTPYNFNTISKLMTEMTQLIEQFLIIIETESAAYHRQKMLTESYGKRDAYDLFSRNTERLLKELNSKKNPSWEDYWNKHQLIEAFILHPATAKQKNTVSSQEDWMESMDQFIIGKKLWMDVEFKARQNFVNFKYDFPFLETILKLVAEKYRATNSTYRTYQAVLSLLEKKNIGTIFSDKANVF